MADKLFVTALNLVEDRRGGLLVVLDDPSAAGLLMSQSDLLSSTPVQQPAPSHTSKDHFHYLLRNKSVLDLPTTILETIARIDGALILDAEVDLLAFGAILHYPDLIDLHPENIEGGRSSAAIAGITLWQRSQDQRRWADFLLSKRQTHLGHVGGVVPLESDNPRVRQRVTPEAHRTSARGS